MFKPNEERSPTQTISFKEGAWLLYLIDCYDPPRSSVGQCVAVTTHLPVVYTYLSL